jgi:gliding motility-associated-like protein
VAKNGFCADTTSVMLSFVPCEITVPNVFTPNGDGFNDVLKFTNLEYHINSRLVVYNRWGRIVYENDDYKNDWDGGGLDDGVYYFILYLPVKVKMIGTEDWFQDINGSVTIMR